MNYKELKIDKIKIIKCSRGDVLFMNMNYVYSSVQGKSNLIWGTIISRYIDIDLEGFVPGASIFILGI